MGNRHGRGACVRWDDLSRFIIVGRATATATATVHGRQEQVIE